MRSEAWQNLDSIIADLRKAVEARDLERVRKFYTSSRCSLR